MQLAAAASAVRTDNMRRTELRLELQEAVHGTDCTPVLKYIQNDWKRSQTVVADKSWVHQAVIGCWSTLLNPTVLGSSQRQGEPRPPNLQSLSAMMVPR